MRADQQSRLIRNGIIPVNSPSGITQSTDLLYNSKLNSQGNSNHLPESLADSGSEPPHDENTKLAGQGGNTVAGKQSSPEVISQDVNNGQLKHSVLLPLGSQNIKHLPNPADLSLNINQPIHQPLHSVS